MNAIRECTPAVVDGAVDVLSRDEETMLGELRDVIGGMRARGIEIDADAVDRAVSLVGASPIAGNANPGERTYARAAVCMAARTTGGPGGGVEVRFLAIWP